MSRENLRVLLVSDMGKIGGTEIATLIAATELKPLIDTVCIFGKSGPLFETIAELGVEQINAECHTKNPVKLLNYVYQLVNTVNRNKIDVIHAQMARPLPFIWFAKKFFKNKNVKIFWTSRGLEHETYQKVVPFFVKLGVIGLGNCKLEQKKLIRYGYPEKKTSYIYNAYRLTPTTKEMKPLNKDTFVIGTLSALREGRCVELFLHLVKYITENYSDKSFQFIIGGNGEYRETLERLALELNISHSVKFLGNITDVSLFMDNIDIFVSPLVVDGDSGAGLSNSIVEAMIMKVPVCAFKAAGIEEIVINDNTGYLIEPRDIPAMAKAIINIIDDATLTEQYVNNAYELIIRECDPKEYAQKLLRLYKEL